MSELGNKIKAGLEDALAYCRNGAEGRRVHKIWPVHCEDEFDYLAQHDSQKLIALCSGDHLKPTLLTFALEILGRVKDPLVEEILLEHLGHEKCYVREGALYGLSQLEPSIETFFKVGEIAKKDPSPFVRTVAEDLIEDWG